MTKKEEKKIHKETKIKTKLLVDEKRGEKHVQKQTELLIKKKHEQRKKSISLHKIEITEAITQKVSINLS